MKGTSVYSPLYTWQYNISSSFIRELFTNLIFSDRHCGWAKNIKKFEEQCYFLRTFLGYSWQQSFWSAHHNAMKGHNFKVEKDTWLSLIQALFADTYAWMAQKKKQLRYYV